MKRLVLIKNIIQSFNYQLEPFSHAVKHCFLEHWTLPLVFLSPYLESVSGPLKNLFRFAKPVHCEEMHFLANGNLEILPGVNCFPALFFFTKFSLVSERSLILTETLQEKRNFKGNFLLSNKHDLSKGRTRFLS